MVLIGQGWAAAPITLTRSPFFSPSMDVVIDRYYVTPMFAWHGDEEDGASADDSEIKRIGRAARGGCGGGHAYAW